MSVTFAKPLRFLQRSGFAANLLNVRECRGMAMVENSRKNTSNVTVDLFTMGENDKKGKPDSTVDPADVQHHAKLMKEWWDRNGPMKALHSYNTLRVPFVRDGLVEIAPETRTCTPLTGKTILDVGCGGGILSEPLARLGAKVTGIDASPDLIQLATEHSAKDSKLKNNKPAYICTTIEEHAEYCNEIYDGVVASEIIEHVTNQELFVRSCVRALKPGGRIFFTTPNRTKLAEIGVIYIAEYVLKMVPKGTHQIDKFLTPTELTFLLERNNCHVEMVHGILYNYLTNRWSWSNFQEFVFAIQAVKLTDDKKQN